MEATMLNKLINAWGDSYRVVENHRVVRRTTERLLWSGRGANEVGLNARRFATFSSWI
jgi:hypothetical protein